MNINSFKPIAEEALREILEERQTREEYGWMSWPDENIPSHIVINEFCAMLGEGPEDDMVVLGEVCIPKEINEAEAKEEIKRKIDSLLPPFVMSNPNLNIVLMPASNKRMHATADTSAVMLLQRCVAARDARR